MGDLAGGADAIEHRADGRRLRRGRQPLAQQLRRDQRVTPEIGEVLPAPGHERLLVDQKAEVALGAGVPAARPCEDLPERLERRPLDEGPHLEAGAGLAADGHSGGHGRLAARAALPLAGAQGHHPGALGRDQLDAVARAGARRPALQDVDVGARRILDPPRLEPLVELRGQRDGLGRGPGGPECLPRLADDRLARARRAMPFVAERAHGVEQHALEVERGRTPHREGDAVEPVLHRRHDLPVQAQPGVLGPQALEPEPDPGVSRRRGHHHARGGAAPNQGVYGQVLRLEECLGLRARGEPERAAGPLRSAQGGLRPPRRLATLGGGGTRQEQEPHGRQGRKTPTAHHGASGSNAHASGGPHDPARLGPVLLAARLVTRCRLRRKVAAPLAAGTVRNGRDSAAARPLHGGEGWGQP